MAQSEKNQFDYYLLGRVLRLTQPYKRIFRSSLILAIILAPVQILRPKLVQIMVDDYIFQYDLEGLGKMAILFLIALFGAGILRYSFLYCNALLGQSVIKDLRSKVFNHLLKLRLTYFDTTPIGTATTRTISDIEAINTVFSQGAITIVADLLTVFAVIIIMLDTSWRLTLVCLVTMPFMILATYIFKEKVKSAYQIVRTKISQMNAFLQERISGMRIVQIFNAEEQEMKKFNAINRDYTQANLDSILYYAIFYPVVEIISATSLALMVWWGARSVIGGEVTLGALVAFPIYISMLFRPIRMLADRFNTLQMGLVASQRVFDLLDKDYQIKDEGTVVKNHVEGHVVFDQLSFAYAGNQKILKDLSFEIEPKKTLAIVGSTGSGKTTIINVLNRFYPYESGNIYIDGTELRDFQLDHLRKHIAVVLQDVFLFSGTVLENITLLDKSISKDRVIDASKMIGAHDFIVKLPGQYEYQVMERGATLSMGQRQLISFVRALVFNPDILILDEATSSIDPETESIIQQAIETLIDKRTSIIIAHRLSTIKHADKILVLEKGEIKEWGTHEELVSKPNGHYKDLYEMQFLAAVSD